MMKCRSPRSLVFGIRNLLWFLVRSEYAISGRSDKYALNPFLVEIRGRLRWKAYDDAPQTF